MKGISSPFNIRVQQNLGFSLRVNCNKYLDPYVDFPEVRPRKKFTGSICYLKSSQFCFY